MIRFDCSKLLVDRVKSGSALLTNVRQLDMDSSPVSRPLGGPADGPVAGAGGGATGCPRGRRDTGTEQHLLAPGEPSALMLGALLTIAATSAASVLAANRLRLAGSSAEEPHVDGSGRP